MLRVGILAGEQNGCAEQLVEAFTRRGAGVRIFPATRLVAGVARQPRVSCLEAPLEQLDALLVRSLPGGSLEQVIYRMDVLHRLVRLGVRVINSPAAIEKTVDKYYTSAILEEAGLPTPRTVVAEKFGDAMDAFREMGDVVVKPLFGSLGNGMVRISDEELAYRTFRALELARYVFYVQEYIPHRNRDIRAFVVGGRVVAAILRTGNGWKTNMAKGARAEPLRLTVELEEQCLRAVAALGADYAGVDILPGEDGKCYIIEVNGIPGWAGLQGATGLNVAGEIADYVLKLFSREYWRCGG